MVDITFDPNCEFPVDMTQEELDELITSIKKLAEDGILERNSTEIDLDKLKEEDPELYQSLISCLEHMEKDTKPN